MGAPTLTKVDLGVQYVAVDPRDDSLLYVGTSLGLYVTRNGGGSWEEPSSSGFIGAIVIDPLNVDRVYAIVNAHTLVRSADRGASFVTIKTFDDPIASIHVSTRTAGTLFVGFGDIGDPNPSGILKSSDDWSDLDPRVVWRDRRADRVGRG